MRARKRAPGSLSLPGTEERASTAMPSVGESETHAQQAAERRGQSERRPAIFRDDPQTAVEEFGRDAFTCIDGASGLLAGAFRFAAPWPRAFMLPGRRGIQITILSFRCSSPLA